MVNSYIASRIFLHNPPGEDNALRVHPDAPEEIKQQEWHLAHAEPEVNQYVCIALLVVAVAIMAFTAEMVNSIHASSLVPEILYFIYIAGRKYRVRERTRQY